MPRCARRANWYYASALVDLASAIAARAERHIA
jgi:hypothetical protein